MFPILRKVPMPCLFSLPFSLVWLILVLDTSITVARVGDCHVDDDCPIGELCTFEGTKGMCTKGCRTCYAQIPNSCAIENNNVCEESEGGEAVIYRGCPEGQVCA